MHAIELLKQDHRKVEDLLSDLESTSEDDAERREDLFSSLKVELRVHEILEEEILYPPLKEHSETRETTLEGIEEHHVVDRLLGDMVETSPKDETWGAKLGVMKENLEHHIEEEEDELFPNAQEVLDESQLDEMGSRMEERKKTAQSEVKG